MSATQSAAPRSFAPWRFAAASGYYYSFLILAAWAGVAGFLPPPPEYWSTQEVYAYFVENNVRIRIGMALTLIVTPLYFVWGVAVSRVMDRIEGPGAVLSPIQMMGAFGTVVVTWGSVVAWLAAAFDPALKGAEAVKAMSDLAWMWFNPTATVTFAQFVAFGAVCLLQPAGEKPLLPRWLAWFSFAMAATLLMAELTPFFRQGPFTWHGLLCYYVGLGGFFLWILVVTAYVRAAVIRIQKEASA